MGATARDSLRRLVDRFDQNRDAYHSVSYKEEQPVEDADGRQPTACGSRQVRLDAAGREVMALSAGANDVSRLSPGVYFVRESPAEAEAQAVRKVISPE